MKSIVFIAALLLILPTDLVIAQGGFVTCDGVNCSACNFVELLNLLIRWLFGIVFVIFAVLMTVAGFGLVTSGGNQSALDAAKSKFSNAMIGLIIMFSAWLIVDTLMRGIVGGGTTGAPVGEIRGWGPWAQVKCQVQVQTVAWAGDPADVGPTAPTTPLPPVAGGPVSGCTGSTCVPIVGVPCKAGVGCNISPDMVSRLTAFHAAAAVPGARVTEAMPPTYVHQSQCHQNGRCVDYGKAGSMNAAEITRTADAARANGLRPVYEVRTAAEKSALVAAGARDGDIKVISAITAPHFSIYGY